MAEISALYFGPYRLAGPHGPFFRDSQEVKLPPKALAVLWELARQAGQVVTKTALLDTVWPETVVGEAVLTFQIQTLRQALEDDAKQPRYIVTVHRVGYRFVASLSTSPPVVSRQSSVVSQDQVDGSQPATSIVGREAELTRLHGLFAKALNGERQMVFVTGEAGIGKTALVEAFLSQIEAKDWKLEILPSPSPQASNLKPQTSSLWLGRGQCVEHYGTGEAYLPVLEALARLCQQPDGEQLIDVLRRMAPTWLVQLPALLGEAEYATLQQKVIGATQERMLREMTEALEVMGRSRPVILILEDLHWSDVSTVDLLAMLARRREAARFLVLCTHRLAELVVTNHPLKTVKRELVTRGQGIEVPLRYLSAEEVQVYLSQRFADHTIASTLSAFIYQRTEGHPLFMVQMTDYLAQQSDQAEMALTEAGANGPVVPQGLRDLIETQIGRLTDLEQQVLEVGSVAGVEFTAASVAAGMQVALEAVEDVCEQLGQRGQFVEEREVVTWPDGTVSGRYGFRHALYQEVLYRRLSKTRQVRLHRSLGLREEAGYGKRTSEVAAELALHFEQGRDYQRAAQYLRQAGENALRRNTFHGAIHLLSHGLALLAMLPESPVRDQQELALQLALGGALMAGESHGAPEVNQAYARAQVLCQGMRESSQLVLALSGLAAFYYTRSQTQSAVALAQQCLEVAQRLQHPALLASARATSGIVSLGLGVFADAREQLTQATAFYDARPSRSGTLRPTIAQEVTARSYLGAALWMLGYPDQGLRAAQQALTMAKQLEHPPSVGFAAFFLGAVRGYCREGRAVHEAAQLILAVAREQGLRVWHAHGAYARGEALVLQGQYAEGSESIRQAIAECTSMGVELGRAWRTARLAEAQGKMGQVEEGLATVAAALAWVSASGERYYEAELWRLKGELTLQQLQVSGFKFQAEKGQKSKVKSRKSKSLNPQPPTPSPKEAEACFHKALAVARQQEARSLELRAGMSLARLWQQQGKRKEAHAVLAEVYGWFSEGFETADLQEAKALLEVLSA